MSMKKSRNKLGAVKLIGIAVRTCNALEMDPETAKIGQTIGRYFSGQLNEQIDGRVSPGTTYCVYTDYASDENGEYTYFVGELVRSLDEVPSGFEALIIPEQNYIKFTTEAGPMPSVCMDAWKEIWAMSPEDFGSGRDFVADFEVYDERAQDPENTSLDIYIGVR